MSITNAFPRRPLQFAHLPSARIGLLELLGIVLFVGALVADVIYLVPPIVDDFALGGAAVAAQEAHLGEGSKCQTRTLVTICTLEVTFRAGDGVNHQKSLNYLTAGESVDDSTRLRVGYDPANPDRVTTNWGRDLIVNRVITEIVAVAFLVFLVGGFVLSYLSSLRRRRSMLAMAVDPRAVVAKLVRVRAGQKFATIHFTWVDPATGTTRRDSSRMAGTAQPFWLDPGRTTMLALAGPDGHAHLLDEDLKLVVLTDAERGAIRQAKMGSMAAASA
jgi:hypothetical protein